MTAEDMRGFTPPATAQVKANPKNLAVVMSSHKAETVSKTSAAQAAVLKNHNNTVKISKMVGTRLWKIIRQGN